MSEFLQPLVSVIIPTHNRANLILRAINSVLAQSYQNLEIIVVDDYSQDNTTEIIQTAMTIDSRLHYYRHSSNLGGSAARNTGILQAKGDYIAFLDSDDIWRGQKLELQLKAIAKQSKNSQPVVSYTQFQKSHRVFYLPSVLPRRGKKVNETVAEYLWLGGGEILTSTLIVSRSLAVEHLFQADLPKHQDLDFILRLGATEAIFIFEPQVLTIWHNEARNDRISRIDNYQLSQNWIASYQDRISERAYKGFLLKEVVPRMLLAEKDKSIAFNLLFEGLWHRIIPLNFFLYLMAKQAISRKFQKSCKRFLQKLNILDSNI